MKAAVVKHIILLCSLVLACAALPSKADSPSIVNAIENDSIIVINQPEALLKRVSVTDSNSQEEETQGPTTPENISGAEKNSLEASSEPVSGTLKSAGYRVQVFSDNNARTAKSEARAKAQAIQGRLPHYRTYVVYQSPYWRLKVGDFVTRTDAENAADEIKKIFPAYAREVRVVKDRINRQ